MLLFLSFLVCCVTQYCWHCFFSVSFTDSLSPPPVCCASPSGYFNALLFVQKEERVWQLWGCAKTLELGPGVRGAGVL